MKNNPLISVVIPTKNSAEFLARCLRSIKNQTYKNIEIIVVDNNSTDETKKITREFTHRIYNCGPERCAQVNFGVKKAKGEYVYQTGSDLTREKELVKEAVNKCEREKYDAVYINVITKIPNPNIWQQVRGLERQCYVGESGMSAARFFKRSIFLALGGYDESLGSVADDLEFQHRLNLAHYKTGFIKAKENNIDEYKSLKIIITRSLYYGWFIKRYWAKHPQKTKKQYRLIRQEFIKHRKILFKNKFLLSVFIFYKLVQYFFGGIGLLLAKTSRDNQKIENFLYRLNYRT